MKHGKYEVQKATRSRRGVRVLMVALAVVLAVCCATGGTIAWLTSTPDAVSGTFVIGNINITLSDETKTLNTETANTIDVSNAVTSYTPGQQIKSNPRVTVAANSEACFLFIHIDEENNTFDNGKEKIVQWKLATTATIHWQEVQGHSGYYYREVPKYARDATYQIFDQTEMLTVNKSLTKETIDATGFHSPTITITAAAVQRENIPDSNGDNTVDVADAWALLPTSFTEKTDSGN